MPESGISLLPQEVERVRRQEARDVLLRRLSLLFLVLAVLIGGLVFGYSLALQGTLSNLEESISQEKSKIASLSEVELKARDLDLRSKALSKVFAETANFSVLLTAIQRAVPADVRVTEMVVPSKDSISISGSARSYISLRNFLLDLRGSRGAESIFETVEFRSASLDKQTGEVKFDVQLKIAEGALKR